MNADSTTTSTTENRASLLKEVINFSLEAAYGIQRSDDQQIGTMLGNLVRAKLMSADDSYRLKDRLINREIFNRLLDSRIERALRRRGLLAAPIIDQPNAFVKSSD